MLSRKEIKASPRPGPKPRPATIHGRIEFALTCDQDMPLSQIPEAMYQKMPEINFEIQNESLKNYFKSKTATHRARALSKQATNR